METSCENSTNNLSKLKFKGTWRSYQQRVLDELSYHLTDKKLNVVAAPGAGKTTLGIEVLVRLNKRALILAPTITIKNQWKERMVAGFLPDGEDASWISDDIKNISDITVSTYQALHSIYKEPKEKTKFLKDLKKYNINTLVLDEAHHLRTEWYTTLNNLCQEIDNENFTVVSLTGTPPYDVSAEEWKNYNSLCGDVDAEISIPELVKNKDLCPHQDLVYFSNLSEEEKKVVFDFNKNREEFFRYIKEESDILYSIESSVFLNDLEKNIDIIYKNTNFTISIISYLFSIDKFNMPANLLTQFLGLNNAQIPEFDYDIAQTLFNGMLGQFETYFNNIPLIKGKLKELNLIKGKKVDFLGETDFKNLFARSTNKLNAISEITKVEYQNLKNDLREVILLDYIGKGDSLGLNIFSVFDKLSEQNINLAILTGSLMVIPKTAKDELYKILDENHISPEKVLVADFNKKYLRVETYGEVHIVSYITKLFERGFINILIGTAALLGEGWDSPCTNTLIIASVVGSFMLSNQMRGRALRIDKNNPNKTANIWHLVSLSDDIEEDIDFGIIKKRFNTFEGISYTDNKIQNGIERLNLSYKNINELDCDSMNKRMFSFASQRNELINKWNQIFTQSKITEKNMTAGIYEMISTKPMPIAVNENQNFWQKMVGDLYNHHRVNLSQKEQLIMAKCILKTLCDMGAIKTPYKELKLQTKKDKYNNFSITLVNGFNNERNLFVKSFCEIFNFSDDMRYLIKIPDKNTDKYIPIPEIIGQKQEYVKIFSKYLKKDMFALIPSFLEFSPQILFGVIASCVVSFFAYLIYMDIIVVIFIIALILFFIFSVAFSDINASLLSKKKKIDIIFTKSAKNQQEVLKAKYNTYLTADISRSRVWI